MLSSADGLPEMPTSSPPHHWLPLMLLPFLLLLLCCLISLLLAKLLLRTQHLQKCQQEPDFLRPTPKKRVFTVATCKQLQLQQQQQQQNGIIGRTVSPSFESGQFSRPREIVRFSFNSKINISFYNQLHRTTQNMHFHCHCLPP